jgi:hypothetical protein
MIILYIYNNKIKFLKYILKFNIFIYLYFYITFWYLHNY